MEQTQANAPAPAQAQTPVHPIHEETATLNALTQWVSETPDNDPHAGTDLEAPKPEAKPATEAAPQAEEKPQEETIEFDEETPIFDLDYKTDKGREVKKVSLKELREGYLAKEDYSRRQKTILDKESEIEGRVQQATLKAQQDYLQRLEQHKQLVLKTVAPEIANVDLVKLSMEDPAEAQRIYFKQQQITATLQNIEHEQRTALQQHQEAMKVAQFKAIETARKTLEEDIPGWNADLYNNVLGTVAKEYGFKGEEVAPVVDARLIKVFHDAYQYRSLQKAKPEISKRVVTVPKVVKPGSGEKPNPAKERAEEAEQRLKKTGRLDDAVSVYLARQKK
jgi:hypothetical protein